MSYLSAKSVGPVGQQLPSRADKLRQELNGGLYGALATSG
jgi:hypothetical protein